MIRTGTYDFDEEDRKLRQAGTGQSLAFKGRNGAREMIFEYVDRDVQTPIIFEILGSDENFGVIDLNDPLNGGANGSYGLCRRLTYFLLDSLPIWFGQTPAGRLTCEIIGGWQNGAWIENIGVIVSAGRGGNETRGGATVRMDLFPLAGQPVRRHYLHRDSPPLYFSLQTEPGPGERPPLVKMDFSLEEQIESVPSFRSEDQNSFLYHRYVKVDFFRGEDYTPSPYYGYVNRRYGFTMRTLSFGSQVFEFLEPILVDHDLDPSTFFSKAPYSQSTICLTAQAHEELVFALFEIDKFRHEASFKPPIILEHDRENLERYKQRFPNQIKNWKGIPFGSTLQGLNPVAFTSIDQMSVSLRFRKTWEWRLRPIESGQVNKVPNDHSQSLVDSFHDSFFYRIGGCD